MIKRLVVNGCSWTSGNELEHSPEFIKLINDTGLRKQDPKDYNNWNLLDKNNQLVSRFDQYYDQFNWAGYLKEKLDIPELVNLSTGGGSNTRILRTTIDYVMSLPRRSLRQTLVVIGWTASDRDEIYVNNGWQRWNATQAFSTTVDRLLFDDKKKIKKIDKMQQDYIANVQSDYAAVFKYFQQCYLLANLLENLKIPYVFFNALPTWWASGPLAADIDADEFSNHIEWQQQNNRFITDTTMFNFINDGDYPLAPYKHPLAQGHAAWADYLYNDLTERQLI
jgi:hypothetical protein